MHRVLCCLILLVGFGGRIVAQEGKSSYDFLNIPVSSHAHGLGGNNISIIEEDITMAYQNPALLGQEMDMQLSLNYMRYVADMNIAGVSFGKAARARGAWSVGMQYFGYGEMKLAESNGVVTGTFSPKDIIFNGMFSYDITGRLRGGIDAKLVYSNYEQYSALALCVDLGVNYYNPETEWSLSAVVKNAGGQLKRFNETFERMPLDVQLGLSKTFRHAPFRISVTAQHLTRWKMPYTAINDKLTDTEDNLVEKNKFAAHLFRHFIFAADYVPSQNLYIGLGYNYKTRSDMSTYRRNFLSGFSLGAGIKVKMFSIGASYAQHHIGGNTFMFNLTAGLSQFLR